MSSHEEGAWKHSLYLWFCNARDILKLNRDFVSLYPVEQKALVSLEDILGRLAEFFRVLQKFNRISEAGEVLDLYIICRENLPQNRKFAFLMRERKIETSLQMVRIIHILSARLARGKPVEDPEFLLEFCEYMADYFYPYKNIHPV